MELSPQGRVLTIAVVGGLFIGAALAFVVVADVPLTYLLLQDNGLVARGWVWQLFTSVIVAPPNLNGLVDVAFNAIALVWLDGLFSLAYSKRQYYAVFVATAVAGNIFSLANGPLEVSFGASGGIFGLLAGVVSYDLATSRRLNVTLVLWFATIFIVSSFLFSYVDWMAHLGGSIVGLALGYFVGATSKDEGASA
ncbi:MAG TPA: rhomboid family intramembrane serine protease [Nitrososphaerales archaeon]|nr:rhomboid family intramembrane serine protease [Nitrososphaerales archaeon]